MTTGRDPMTPMGLYVSRTLFSEVETHWRQRRVIIAFNNEIRSLVDGPSSGHVYHDSKVTGQATDEGKRS